MVEHMKENHEGRGLGDPAEVSFKMKIHRRYKTALERQLGEAINIAKGGVQGPKEYSIGKKSTIDVLYQH